MIEILSICALTLPTASAEPAYEAPSLFATPRWTPSPAAIADASEHRAVLDYTYIEAQGLFGDRTGFRLEGSYRFSDDNLSVGDRFFISAGAELVEDEIEGLSGGDRDVEFGGFQFEGGYILPLYGNNDLHFVTTLGVESLDYEATLNDVVVDDGDEIGFRVGGQLRYLLLDRLEVNGSVLYRSALTDSDNPLLENDFQFGVGAVLRVVDQLRLVGDVTISDDVWFSFGARYSF